MNNQFTQLKAHKMAQFKNLSDDEIQKIADAINAAGYGPVLVNNLVVIFNSNPLRAEELEQIEQLMPQKQSTKVAKPYYRQHEKY